MSELTFVSIRIGDVFCGQVIKTWLVSLYTITVQLKHVNFSRNHYLS